MTVTRYDVSDPSHRQLSTVSKQLLRATVIALLCGAVFAFCAKPSQAQDYTTYTLSNVLLADGGTASGYFDYSQKYDAFSPTGVDIVTTSGTSDGFPGTTYDPATLTGEQQVINGSNITYYFTTIPYGGSTGSLFALTTTLAQTPTQVLAPGSVTIAPLGVYPVDSSEIYVQNGTPYGRGVVSGSLVATPEVGSVISFAIPLLLMITFAFLRRRQLRTSF